MVQTSNEQTNKFNFLILYTKKTTNEILPFSNVKAFNTSLLRDVECQNWKKNIEILWQDST